MKKSFYFTAIILVISSNAFSQEPEDTTTSTFKIFLSADLCDVTLKYDTKYSEKVDSIKGVRIIDANGIPDHQTGAFPNHGNPNTISPQTAHYEIPLVPTVSEEKISAKGKRIGVLFSGVEVDPFTNEFFEGKKGRNQDWNITTLTSTYDLGLDCNNAHVQPGGKYHYHGTPNAYLDQLGVDGTGMIKIGYAADGYPIYYKYGYNSEGELISLESSYSLKDGDRPGDGKTAPDGAYDGTYFQDYEFQEGLSELDECNGRIGKTPDSESEYYYVVTDNFPSTPICFSAVPSDDFGMNGPPGGGNRPGMAGGQPQNRPGGGRPNPAELMKNMDTNRDGKIARAEAKGPMVQHFDKLDANGDGFIDAKELENMGPPR